MSFVFCVYVFLIHVGVVSTFWAKAACYEFTKTFQIWRRKCAFARSFHYFSVSVSVFCFCFSLGPGVVVLSGGDILSSPQAACTGSQWIPTVRAQICSMKLYTVAHRLCMSVFLSGGYLIRCMSAQKRWLFFRFLSVVLLSRVPEQLFTFLLWCPCA